MLLGLLRARSSIGGWDPASTINGGTLDTANRVYTGDSGSGYSHVRGILEITGLRYFSAVTTGVAGQQGVGIARDGASPLTSADYVGDVGSAVAGWGASDGVYHNGSRIFAVSSSAWEFAVRASSGRVWVRASGGAWLGGGDPAADTSPTCTLTGSGALRACATCALDTSTARLHSAAETTGTPPSGFTVGL